MELIILELRCFNFLIRIKGKIGMTERILSGELMNEDLQIDISLRPKQIQDFVGQDKIKEQLQIFIQAAKERKESLDHALFFGPPGLGKTTLAHIIAQEMGTRIHITSGPAIEKAGDLAGIFTNLERGDILFIDEIHRLNRVVEEYLYPAMEDFALDILIDKGPNARSVRLNLEQFTLVGATTRSGMITSPLRSRFGMNFRLDYYHEEELVHIIHRSAHILDIGLDADAALEISRRSRGTPRIANSLLRRVRDYAQVKADNHINLEVADKALSMLNVDRCGLDEMDKRLLETMIHKFDGGPVGVNTLALSVSEEVGTIEEVYEPYLIQEGFMQRTPQGRKATVKAYEHLHLLKKFHQAQDNLF